MVYGNDANGQEMLEKDIKRWIKILELGEWDIKVKIKRKDDLENENNSGEIRFNFVHKEAIVSLLDSVDYINEDFGQDMECTLVHELLHLKFAILDVEGKDITDNQLGHQLLHDMAKALVRVDRMKYYEQPSVDVNVDIDGSTIIQGIY